LAFEAFAVVRRQQRVMKMRHFDVRCWRDVNGKISEMRTGEGDPDRHAAGSF
jgi:preprotein translocase subunit SecA